MEVKEILFNLRKTNNLTQDEMAKKLFVTRQAVSRWENGETIPNVDTLKLISNIFDISINSLITDNKLNDIQNDKINSNRFLGFAQLYEKSRPAVPASACDMVMNYLEQKPEQIVDLGCGTGLSTMAWIGKCDNIIGIDPNDEMLSIAKQKSNKISFIKAYSDSTTLSNNSTDIVICSQSFHWMNPADTLKEVNRILKSNGVFATIDCDWPPICSLEAELAYTQLLNKVRFIELENKDIFKTFQRWNKDKHLQNIKVDLTNTLAKVFEVSPQALTVPDIDSYNGLMHTLFTLEDLYGLRIDTLSDKVCIRLDKGMGTNYITMFEMFSAWQKQAEKLKNGEISKEEYDTWRYNYPASEVSKI